MLTPASPLPTRRADLMARLAQGGEYDIAVVGGGATGLGVALDAASRGLRVVLVESHDFAKGTSSRATKLVHGGVRYLAQGNISLVREALHERTTLLHNAPHIAQPLAFVLPAYRRWDQWFYGIGLKVYDLLAGKAGLGKTEFLSAAQTKAALPKLQPAALSGGVRYWDGQFNDARLAMALARTAAANGALLVNYCSATALTYQDGQINGLQCLDTLTGQQHTIRSRCVVNAAGVWVDELREKDSAAHQAAGGQAIRPMVAPSQGVHIVVDREFLGGDNALMVPKTADGRVLFAVPWLGKVILGTTDTPRHDLAREPEPFEHELEFILSESARYLQKAPQRKDIKSIWVGLRPLVKPPDDDGESTKALSREHTVLISRSGLVTVTGGKWTTYRSMAQDVLEKCEAKGLLKALAPCKTADMPLVGVDTGPAAPRAISEVPGVHSYGSEVGVLLALPGSDVVLCEGLTEGMVRFAARYEYAVTVEDMLARRSRLLFLDAHLAAGLAVRVGQILQEETGLDPQTADFLALAARYLEIPGKKS